MSTILKALRRLEEDNPPVATEQTGSPARTNSSEAASGAESRTPDDLRDRILAEEVAARATPIAEEVSGSRNRRRLFLGAAAAAIMLLSIGAAFLLSRDSDAPEPAGIRVAATPPSAVVAAPARAERPVRVTAAPPSPFERAPGSEPATAEPAPTRRRPDAAGTARLAAAGVVVAGSLAGAAAASDSSDASDGAASRSSADAGSSALAAAPPSASAAAVPKAPAKITPNTLTKTAARTSRKPAIKPAPKPAAQSASMATPKPPTRPAAGSKRMEVAAVTPTQSSLEANRTAEPSSASASTPSKSPEARPVPKTSERGPAKVSAPKPAPKPAPTPPERISAAKPAPDRVAAESRKVESVDRANLPDVTVLRTSWHPRPDRRSAKIRLESSDEIMTLREGDAVGGLVISKISPSAVLFKTGDVEIRRRVGSPGS